MTPQAGHDDLVNGHEEAFLAYLMSAPDACDKFLHRVSEHILSVPHHRKVLAAIRDVYDERDKVNLLTVSDRLSDKRELEECGGRHGITVIATSTTSASGRPLRPALVEPPLLPQPATTRARAAVARIRR